MTDFEVATGILPLGQSYNTAETQASRYIKHDQTYLFPQQNNAINSSSSSRVVRFLVGSQGFMDTSASYVAINASCASGDATDLVYFPDYMDCILSRITILTNQNVIIEEVRDAGTLAAMLRREMEPSYSESVGRECLNILGGEAVANSTNIVTTPSTTNLYLTEAQKTCLCKSNKRYILELAASGFMSDTLNWKPLKSMAGQNSTSYAIELEFAPVVQAVIAHGAAGLSTVPVGPISYQISNIVLVQSLIFDDMKEAELQETIRETPLVYHYPIRRNFLNTLPSGSATTTIQIAEFQENVRGLKTAFRSSTAVALQQNDYTQFINPGYVFNSTTASTAQGLQQMQSQVGPRYFPNQPIQFPNSATGGFNGLAEQYYNYVISCGKQRKYWKGFNKTLFQNVVPTTGNNYKDNLPAPSKEQGDLILAFDYQIYPEDAIGDPEYEDFYSGLNLRNNPQSIQLLLRYSQIGEDILASSFTEYDANLIIQANEVYVLS